MSKIVKSGFTRSWIILNGVGPKNEPIYHGELKFEDPSRSFGDITPIEIPNPAKFNDFIEVDSIKGAIERATFGLTGRYPIDISTLLELARLGCRIDVQAHIGDCRDPRDYDNNWNKIVVFEDARITSYSIEGFGAIESGERAPTNESVEISSASFYEIGRLMFAELEPTEISEIVRDVSVFGVLGCDDCDDLFIACDTVFIVQDAENVGGAVGALNPPKIIFSNDKFATVSTDFNTELTDIDSIADATFVGTFYAMISETANTLDGGISWISLDDAFKGISGWTSPATNPFTSPNTPVKMWSESPRDTIIVGRNGYIWKMKGIGDVTELDAGTTTTEDLVSIHAFDLDKWLAGGDLNTILFSVDGGGIWSIVTGPVAEAANQVKAVWMLDEFEWLIGYDNGNMHCTNNAGVSWNQISLPISTTSINEFMFATESVGVVAVTTSSPDGGILRTSSGGFSWRVMPDGIGNLPSNTDLLSIAMCGDEPNLVYSAGEGSVAGDGILIKGVNA